ncbi:MAG: asparagine synthetase B, partial [Bacteroidetes bacterium]
MSGILALWYLDGRPVETATLDRMAAAMPYRGPDGITVEADGAIGLGQLRLHTTPEAIGAPLPRWSADRRCALVADARLDNRTDLIDVLALPSDAPDSHLLLAAYERWGPACVDHLMGDFAFVVWDARARRLVAGRDHFGMRPLYYV